MYQPKGLPTVVEEPSPAAAPRTSVLWMLAGTVVGGISGYLALWLTARRVGAADYAVFGVFWSALFLVVGVLFGLQQEATRATSMEAARPRREPAGGRSSLWVFAAVAGAAVVGVVLLTSVLWAPASFGANHAGLAVQVTIGAGLSAIVAVGSGVFAGRSRWRVLGIVVASDGVLRLAAVSAALALGAGADALAWAVVAPYGVIVIAFALWSGRLGPAGRVGISYRRLTANASRTVLAASATAVLINGFPLVLALTGPRMDAAALGALIFAITLTRAPLLVPLMALQSYLVTAFTTDRRRERRILVTWLAIIVAVAVAVALAAGLLGEWAMGFFVGPEFALPGVLLAALVLSSGCIGALCVTGPAVLARNLHTAYAVGWLVASAVTIGLLFLPLPTTAAVPLALAVGPVIGAAVHLGLLGWSATDRRTPGSRSGARA